MDYLDQVREYDFCIEGFDWKGFQGISEKAVVLGVFGREYSVGKKIDNGYEVINPIGEPCGWIKECE